MVERDSNAGGPRRDRGVSGNVAFHPNGRTAAAPPALPRGWRGAPSAHDFLGLNSELGGRRAHAHIVDETSEIAARSNIATSPAELMRVAPTTERGASISVADLARPNSWLLDLDDARSGRAGLDPVVPGSGSADAAVRMPAQLDVSYASELPRARRVPLLVGMLVALAAGSLIVVTWTAIRVSSHAPNARFPAPLELVDAPRAPQARAELVDPSARVVPTADSPSSHETSELARKNPAQPAAPVHRPQSFASAPSNAIVRPRAAGTERAHDTFAKNSSTEPISITHVPVPDWWRGALNDEPLADSRASESPAERRASIEREERIARYLMIQSRSSSPLADISAQFPACAEADAPTGANADASRAEADVAQTTSKDGAAVAAPKAARKTALPAQRATDGVWEGSTIPMDQVGSSTRIRTPDVGRVRVHLSGGTTLDGLLYAVGKGQLWIDTLGGRVSLARDRIERVEQRASTLAANASAGDAATFEKSSDPATTDFTSLPRMRVRTPGGLFFGRIVAREGNNVTLVTDQGTRVTLQSDNIEPAPLQKFVIKHPAAPAPAPKTQGFPRKPEEGEETSPHPY